MVLNKKIFQICSILTFQNSNLFLGRPYGTAHLSANIRKIYGHKAPATQGAICPGTQGSPVLRELFVRGHKALGTPGAICPGTRGSRI